MLPETCSFPNCGRKIKAVKLRLCTSHYDQHLAGKPLTEVWRRNRTCSIDGCKQPSRSREMCSRHYSRFMNYGDPHFVQSRFKNRVCSIDGCDRAHIANGYCSAHDYRSKNGLNLNAPITLYGDYEKRFWSNVEKTNSCWNWVGTISGQYGQFSMKSKRVYAHRHSYEMAYGPVADSLQIDHMCHNKTCVNPAHLRPTTPKQNKENHNGPNSDSKTGIRGVFPAATPGKFCATVVSAGKNYRVGTFDSIEKAEMAVIAKRNELHTHNDLDRI